MKKVLSLLFLSLFTLLSCKNDDTTVYPVEPRTRILGTWKFVKEETYQKGNLIDTEDLKSPNCDYDYYILNVDGNKEEVYHDSEDNCSKENYKGKWTYDVVDNILTVVDDEDGYKIIFEPIEISKTDLKLKLISDNGTPVPADFEVLTYLKK